MSESIQIYDEKSEEYDQWFDQHPILFESELKALEKTVPKNKFGVEIIFFKAMERLTIYIYYSILVVITFLSSCQQASETSVRTFNPIEFENQIELVSPISITRLDQGTMIYR